MITKSELQAVYRDMLAEDRSRHGDPPSVEELLAYERGDLSADHTERVRQLLECYPDLARALAAPFPSDDARPGDPDYLTDEVLTRQWASLRPRIRRAEEAEVPVHAGGRVLRFWRGAALALAAATVLAFGGLLYEKQSNVRLARQLVQPRLRWEEQMIDGDGRRGAGHGPKVLSMDGDVFYLVAPVNQTDRFSEYRIEIVGGEPPAQRSLWSGTAQRRINDTFAVVVPHAFMPPGSYRVVVYGVNGAREEPLANYPVQVPER